MNEQTTLPVQSTRENGLPAVFGRLREEIDQLFDDFNFSRPVRNIFQMPGTLDFSPVVEMKDRKDRYELAVELPGMDDKDIDIEYSDGVLSISGEKRAESEEKTGDFLLSERSYGAFRRRLTLPSDADPNAIEASYRHGVLQIKVKKDQQAVNRVRKIAVS